MDFSNVNDYSETKKEAYPKNPVDQKNIKAKKDKIMAEFLESNHPYFIQNEEKSINEPINTMDCIRIFQKLKDIKEKKEDNPNLWSPLHYCQFFLETMTVVKDNKPDTILLLIRGKSYERHRGNQSERADASNCNLNGNWPEKVGAYA